MHRSARLTLGLLAVLESTVAQSTVGFGPYFSLGPTQSWIREANTTLVLPETPTPDLLDRLALWPGMGTSAGDLIQALALGGEQVPASPGDGLTMHYVYNDDTGEYEQTVSINGQVVSSLSTSSGQAEGWGTAVECQDDACQSTAPAHQYLSTTIILDSADQSFGDTLAINEADSSGLTTSDDGKTWTVSTININSHTFASKV
ncbi:uncharacterized protein BJX67DRAFT_374176 [Aspergillus lucknowensis]|uniref:Uncharacterized protein n=1 Tax=Aspergillus lucknowensis TaxID=176173 RepID=A0ABR4LHN6_9EURO